MHIQHAVLRAVTELVVGYISVAEVVRHNYVTEYSTALYYDKGTTIIFCVELLSFCQTLFPAVSAPISSKLRHTI